MTREEAIMELKRFSGTTQLKLSANFWTALNIVIKALEQQPNDDCVSRQAVLEVLKNNRYRFNISQEGYCEGKVLWSENLIKDDAYKEIEQLPPVAPTQKWIPVNERLPKASEYVDDIAKYYLVQNEYGDMLVARYTHSGYWKQIYRMEPISDDVVAWMPLPKPYRAEMENE